MQTQILFPVLVLILLTAVTVFRLAAARIAAVRSGSVDPAYYRAYQGVEPERCRVLARHYSNLLEAPVLFYVAAAVILAAGLEHGLLLGLAWAYVALRVLHSIVHTTTNVVLWRLALFGASWLVLLGLWGVIGWTALT